MKLFRFAAISLALLAPANAFSSLSRPPRNLVSPLAMTSSSETIDSLGLTSELRRLTEAFQKIGDDKLRYKQLLYMASNGLDPMPDELKVDENKVLGCLSTVHVHATTSKGEDGRTLVSFTGDSDGLLTKGLVALLVRGLSGNTAEDIQKVDPSFIQTAGISQSLTPGRNNGFLNMLALMKKKASEAEEAPATTESSQDDKATESGDDDEEGPIYNAITKSLESLQPKLFDLVDSSPEEGAESHFTLTIVADAFDGLNLIKRQQLIYMMLGEVMPKIESLQIDAKTPEEAGM